LHEEVRTSEEHPLHALRNELEVLRERAIEKLAASEGPLTTNALQELAFVQAALVAVREKNESPKVR
jgi:hypothetical protein